MCYATGYHVTLARRIPGPVLNENHLIATHATGNWLMVTDWNKSLRLCNGDNIRVGVRSVYEPDGHWDGSDAPDVAGPWRNRPAVRNTWTVINKDDPGGCEPPAAVNNLNITSASAGSLSASWSAPPAGADGYHVNYSCNGKQSWQLAALDHTATAITVTDAAITPGQSCIAAVRARKVTRYGPWTNSTPHTIT